MPATQPLPPETLADPASAPPDDLDRLVKVGLRLAHLLERHVEAAVVIAEAHAACELPDPFPLPPLPNYPADVGLTFSRIARAVRLTKALQARLARAPRSDVVHPPKGAAATPALARASAPNLMNRQRVVIDPDGDRVEPSDSAERLDHEIWEHLEDADTDAAILSRPVPEILAIIRADLGLDPDVAQPAALRTATMAPPGPENVGVVRVVRGQTAPACPPPEGREATNHTNAVLQTSQPRGGP